MTGNRSEASSAAIGNGAGTVSASDDARRGGGPRPGTGSGVSSGPPRRGRGGRGRRRRSAARARRTAGPAQAEVEASGVDGVEQREVLHQRQHRAVPGLQRRGAQPDGPGPRGHQRQDDRGRDADHPGVEVVLGHPVAGVAEGLGLLGEVGAAGERLRGRAPGGDGHQVEDRQRRAHEATPPPPTRVEPVSRARGARAAWSRSTRCGARRAPAGSAPPGRRTGPGPRASGAGRG